MANKLLKPKRGNVENLPKLPIEDGSLIFAYDNNAPSSTVLVDIGERRLALASSYSAYSDNSGKLNGHSSNYFAPASSLSQFADKTAFTGLDETTNNIVKLTRANGGTVQKIIDNVSHATSATIASTANLAKNSNALGGSSLKNVIDKINSTAGSGNAFTGIDTATNNTIKLTRANGGTVQKTIDNVGHATVAQKLGTSNVGNSSLPIFLSAGQPQVISSLGSTLISQITIDGTNLDTLRKPGTYCGIGGNTNSNKPSNVDAFALIVLQSAGGWYTQILYASNNIQKSYSRYYNSGTQVWSSWEENNRLNTRDLSGYVSAPTSSNKNKVWRTDGNGNPVWGDLNSLVVSSLPSTITLGDGNGAVIDQDGATYRQRIRIEDNGTAGDSVFIFQQSSDSGVSYKDLFRILDNSNVIASTFTGYLNGNAKNSNALGGSSLQNIINKINSSVAASDAMVYLGTVGASNKNPTITSLPSTAKVGSAYKVISDGTYAGIAAETGDLFIYASVGWTLIPSGDDGNVFIGDSKNSTFPYKSNNLVVAIGDQKVTSAANITASSGTVSALGITATNLKATNSTITNITGTLNGTAKNADTVDNFHAVNSSALTSSQNSDKIVLAKNIVDYIDAQAFATTAQVQSSISWIEF